MFYRRVNSFPSSPASATPQPVEPEDQFEPFEPFTASCDDPEHTTSSLSDCGSRQSKSILSKTISSRKENAFSLGLPTPRKSTLLSSLSSSPEKVEISGRDVCLKETPQVLGGLRGGVGVSGSRPSPASRLSFIDKKWLERCQVFGEMEADVKPGAGNQEVVKKGGDEGEMQENIQGERVEKVEKDAREARRDATENDEEFKSITSDKDVTKNAPKPHQTAAKSKKVKKKIDDEQGSELTALPIAEDENKLSNRSKSSKKGGRKRQREEENAEGALLEEGGVKKRRRNAKSKEETSGGDPDAAQAGGKKRKAKKKEDENGEEKVDGDTKVPKKVSKEISLYSCNYTVFFGASKLKHHSCQASTGELIRRN